MSKRDIPIFPTNDGNSNSHNLNSNNNNNKNRTRYSVAFKQFTNNQQFSFVYWLCLLANILLRIFNIRFIRLENYTLFNYVISVHVNVCASMSPIKKEGNVDLLEWDGHILRVGEIQYLTVAVVFSSIIRLSGIDIALPPCSFWDGLFSIPTITIHESIESGELDISHPTFQDSQKRSSSRQQPPFEEKKKRLMSPKRLPVRYSGKHEEEQAALLGGGGEDEEDDENDDFIQEDNDPDAIPSLDNHSSKSPPTGASNKNPPESSTKQGESQFSSIKCRLTFKATHNLKMKVMKPLLNRFYERDPIMKSIRLDPKIVLGLYYHGNSQLMVINMHEDVLFGHVPVPKQESQVKDKKDKDIENHFTATEIDQLDEMMQRQDQFYDRLKEMAYYYPFDEIFMIKVGNGELLAKNFYGGKDYEELRKEGFATKKSTNNNHSYFVTEDSVIVEPIQFSLLFYFYVMILLKDFDTNISKTLQEEENMEYANFLKVSDLEQEDDNNEEQEQQQLPKRNKIFARQMSKMSVDNLQSIDIETLMKLYLMKNSGGLVKKTMIKALNAYNEFIILILALVDGKATAPEYFLILINAIVVGFANAARDIMSTNCGKRWYGSGDQWNEEEQCQNNNSYPDAMLIYFVSLCMSAFTQLTLTDPTQDIINLLVWSVAQVYLALTAFTIVCEVGCSYYTKKGFDGLQPFNHSIILGIIFGFLSCLVPVVINLVIWFTPFEILCYVMGALQIILVLGVRFYKEPHRFANAFFYSTIAEMIRLIGEIIKYFMFMFEPSRLRKMCRSFMFVYENHLNDLLLIIVAVGVFIGSIIFVIEVLM